MKRNWEVQSSNPREVNQFYPICSFIFNQFSSRFYPIYELSDPFSLRNTRHTWTTVKLCKQYTHSSQIREWFPLNTHTRVLELEVGKRERNSLPSFKYPFLITLTLSFYISYKWTLDTQKLWFPSHSLPFLYFPSHPFLFPNSSRRNGISIYF